MDRRKFFSLLGLGGGAVVSLAAVKAVAPEVQAIEVRRNRQYVFRVSPHTVSEENLHRMAECLRDAGLKDPIVMSGEVEIFALDRA